MREEDGEGAGITRIRSWLADCRVTIARRELQVLRREKTIVLALAIQLFIAGFSGFLVVGLVSIYDPASVDGFQVDAAVTGEASDEVLAATEEVESVSGTEYDSVDEAFAAFERGGVQAVFETARSDGHIEVIVTAPEGSIETTLVVAESQSVLRALERAQHAERAAFLDRQPLAVPPDRGANPYVDFMYSVLVPMLVFLPVFISGSITVDSITEEVERGTLELLRVAPVTMGDIVAGKALAMIAIVPLQVAAWLALLVLNDVAIANIGWLLVLATAAATIVVALAVATALATPDRQAAQLVYSIAVVAVFGLGSLVPGGPINAAVLLAIDSATAQTLLTVGAVVVVAALAVAATRLLVERVDPNAL